MGPNDGFLALRLGITKLAEARDAKIRLFDAARTLVEHRSHSHPLHTPKEKGAHIRAVMTCAYYQDEWVKALKHGRWACSTTEPSV